MNITPHLRLLFLCLITPSAAQTSTQITGPSTVSLSQTPRGATMATYRSGEFQKSRILQDLNQNGWCDLWCALFQIDPTNLNQITETA